MKLAKIFFIIFIFQIITNIASADTKVAFIDMQYIMDKSLAGQSLKNQLENLHKKNLQDFKKKEDLLKKKEQDVLTKKNILSKDEFQKSISSLTSNLHILSSVNSFSRIVLKLSGVNLLSVVSIKSPLILIRGGEPTVRCKSLPLLSTISFSISFNDFICNKYGFK